MAAVSYNPATDQLVVDVSVAEQAIVTAIEVGSEVGLTVLLPMFAIYMVYMLVCRLRYGGFGDDRDRFEYDNVDEVR